jgi:hypothetical protein
VVSSLVYRLRRWVGHTHGLFLFFLFFSLASFRPRTTDLRYEMMICFSSLRLGFGWYGIEFGN